MRKPFRALLWKEAHESWRIAGGIAFLLAMLILAGIPGLRGLATGPNPPWRLGSYHIIAAVAALGFGFAQANRESREMWSFALHRPVSGVRIFAAKLVVGVVALLLAIGVPYVACLWWLSMPGVRPVPFDRAYWLPAIVSLCATITWYTAGLYGGARQRGFASRLIGQPVAFLASSIAAGAPSFWLALLSIMSLSALLAAAACAEFVGGSDFRRHRGWWRAAVLTTAIGGVAVAFGIAAVTFGLLPNVESPKPPAAPTEGVTVTRDGTVARTSMSERPDIRGVLVSGTLATDARAIESMTNRPYNDPGRWVARLYPGAPGFVMYYERRAGIISIYDDTTGAFRGWIGPNWTSGGKTKRPERFAGSLQVDPLRPGIFGPMVLSGGYYELDPLNRRARLAFAPPAGETLLALSQAVDAGSRSPDMPEPWGNFMVATTDQRIYAIDAQGVTRFSSAYTPGERGRPVRIIRAGDAGSRRTFLWYGPRDPGAGDSLNQVVEVDASGAPVASFQVAGKFLGGAAEPSGNGHAWSRPPALAPLRVMPAFEAVHAALDAQSSARRIQVAVLIGLLSAMLTSLVCWRYGIAGWPRAFWVVLGAVTGPIGPLVMLLLLERPARERFAAMRGGGARAGALATGSAT